jgi:ABC-type uncharacterized transport system, permease component
MNRTTRIFPRLKAYLRFLGVSFAVNVQAVVEYRLNFLVQVFGMILNNAAFAVFWGVLIGKVGNVGGYGFSDVMLIWALVSTSFGLAHVIFGNVRSIGQIVQKGELDLYLLQPKDVFLNVLCSRTVVSAWGDFLYGYIVLALMPGLDLSRFLLFSMLAISGAIVFASVFAAAESLCFFLGDASGIADAITEFLISFSLYPENIFGSGMRWIFYTIIPSGFIAFVPMAALKALDWPLAPLLLAIALAYAAASYGLFRLGLRRYESGNQMSARI